MPSNIVDLTDHVKELMVSPAGEDISLRKMLREKRKAEVRTLYEKAYPVKEGRDPARSVINNMYHQQLEKSIPMVYNLLGNQYGPAETSSRPGSNYCGTNAAARRRAAELAAVEEAKTTKKSQTMFTDPSLSEGFPHPITEDPPRVNPHTVEVQHRAVGREMRSVGVEADPMDIVRSGIEARRPPVTVPLSRKPAAATTTPGWIPHRTILTNTDLTGHEWNKDLVPKMGTATLELKGKPIPPPLSRGPVAHTSRHASRPHDTLFIF